MTDFIPAAPETSAAQHPLWSAAKLYMSQWKEERFNTLRPLGEFFDRAGLSMPPVTSVLSRVKQNLVWYQSNYLLVFLVLSIYSALTSPMFLISGICVGFLWSWSSKRTEPVKVGGFNLPDKVVTILLCILTLFIFYLSSASAVLFWLLMATVTFVFLHAVFMTPPPQDEYGFGAPVANTPFNAIPV